MNGLDKFPGLLGYGGIIAIHADWPMYPKGIGWEIALKSMGNFPKGADFYEIDDIDRCKLLINVDPQKIGDPYNYQNYHLAIWHEDLIELKRKGFIDGVYEKNEYEFKVIEFDKFKKSLGSGAEEDENGNLILYYKTEAGDFKEFKYEKPNPNEYEVDDFNYKNCAYIPQTIKLTDTGINKIKEISQNFTLHPDIEKRVQPLIAIGYYDSVIRETSIMLETKIKEFHSVNFFGQKLIEHHINFLITKNDNFFSAALKCYKGELRTIFKFIRNDFVHNFQVIDSYQCQMILNRINETYHEFHEVIEVYK